MIFAVGSSDGGEFPDLSSSGAPKGPPSRTRPRARKGASAQPGFDPVPPGASARPPAGSSQLPYSTAVPSPSFSALVADAKSIEKRAPAESDASLPALSPGNAVTVGAYDARLNETTFFEAGVLARKIENPNASVLARDSSRAARSEPDSDVPSADAGPGRGPSAPLSVVSTPLRAESMLTPDSHSSAYSSPGPAAGRPSPGISSFKPASASAASPPRPPPSAPPASPPDEPEGESSGDGRPSARVGGASSSKPHERSAPPPLPPSRRAPSSPSPADSSPSSPGNIYSFSYGARTVSDPSKTMRAESGAPAAKPNLLTGADESSEGSAIYQAERARSPTILTSSYASSRSAIKPLPSAPAESQETESKANPSPDFSRSPRVKPAPVEAIEDEPAPAPTTPRILIKPAPVEPTEDEPAPAPSAQKIREKSAHINVARLPDSSGPASKHSRPPPKSGRSESIPPVSKSPSASRPARAPSPAESGGSAWGPSPSISSIAARIRPIYAGARAEPPPGADDSDADDSGVRGPAPSSSTLEEETQKAPPKSSAPPPSRNPSSSGRSARSARPRAQPSSPLEPAPASSTRKRARPSSPLEPVAEPTPVSAISSARPKHKPTRPASLAREVSARIPSAHSSRKSLPRVFPSPSAPHDVPPDYGSAEGSQEEAESPPVGPSERLLSSDEEEPSDEEKRNPISELESAAHDLQEALKSSQVSVPAQDVASPVPPASSSSSARLAPPAEPPASPSAAGAVPPSEPVSLSSRSRPSGPASSSSPQMPKSTGRIFPSRSSARFPPPGAQPSEGVVARPDLRQTEAADKWPEGPLCQARVIDSAEPSEPLPEPERLPRTSRPSDGSERELSNISDSAKETGASKPVIEESEKEPEARFSQKPEVPGPPARGAPAPDDRQARPSSYPSASFEPASASYSGRGSFTGSQPAAPPPAHASIPPSSASMPSPSSSARPSTYRPASTPVSSSSVPPVPSSAVPAAAPSSLHLPVSAPAASAPLPKKGSMFSALASVFKSKPKAPVAAPKSVSSAQAPVPLSAPASAPYVPSPSSDPSPSRLSAPSPSALRPPLQAPSVPIIPSIPSPPSLSRPPYVPPMASPPPSAPASPPSYAPSPPASAPAPSSWPPRAPPPSAPASPPPSAPRAPPPASPPPLQAPAPPDDAASAAVPAYPPSRVPAGPSPRSAAAITDEVYFAFAREKHAWLYEIYKMGGMTLDEFRARVQEKMDSDLGDAPPDAGAQSAAANLALEKLNKDSHKKFKK